MLFKATAPNRVLTNTPRERLLTRATTVAGAVEMARVPNNKANEPSNSGKPQRPADKSDHTNRLQCDQCQQPFLGACARGPVRLTVTAMSSVLVNGRRSSTASCGNRESPALGQSPARIQPVTLQSQWQQPPHGGPRHKHGGEYQEGPCPRHQRMQDVDCTATGSIPGHRAPNLPGRIQLYSALRAPNTSPNHN